MSQSRGLRLFGAAAPVAACERGSSVRIFALPGGGQLRPRVLDIIGPRDQPGARGRLDIDASRNPPPPGETIQIRPRRAKPPIENGTTSHEQA